jgi:hypothetical protein
VPPMDSRKQRRSGRARGGSAIAPLEALERREVLSFSALGYSLPDLVVTAYSAPVTAWGGSLSISANVTNLGTSTIPEPFHQAAGAQSTADSPATFVNVYASTEPKGRGAKVLLGSLSVPEVQQNDTVNVTGTLTLPAEPAAFGPHSHIFLTYVVNPANPILENVYNNDAFFSKQVVDIEPALPNIQVVGFETPTPLVPGDTFTPAIQLANLGTADVSAQGPITVELVASQNQTFGPGDITLGTYTVDSIPPLSTAPSTNPSVGDLNLIPGNNIVTLDSMTITLPSMPNNYFLGVKVDPFSAIKESGKHPTTAFDASVKVGPPIPGVLPINFPSTGNPGTPGTSQVLFPFPFPGTATPSTTTTTTTTTTVVLNGNNSGSILANISHPARRPSQITTGTGTSKPLGTGGSLTGKLGTVS